MGEARRPGCYPSRMSESPPSPPPRVITVTEQVAPGGPWRTRPITPEEHRDISEQLVLGLLDAGVDVREWMDD